MNGAITQGLDVGADSGNDMPQGKTMNEITKPLRILIAEWLLGRLPEQYRGPAWLLLNRVEELGQSMEPLRQHLWRLTDKAAIPDGRPNAKKRYAAATIRPHINATRALLRTMMDSPNLTQERAFEMDNTFRELKGPTLPGNHSDKPISEEDYFRLRDGTLSMRVKVLVTFLRATGARIGETSAILLDYCKVEPERVGITLRHTKRDKVRRVRIDRQLWEHIRSVYAGSIFLFKTRECNPIRPRRVDRDLRRLDERTIGRPISVHQFRRAFGNRMLHQHPGSIAQESRNMGRRAVATTLSIYLDGQLSDKQLGITVEAKK